MEGLFSLDKPQAVYDRAELIFVSLCTTEHTAMRQTTYEKIALQYRLLKWFNLTLFE